MLLHSHNGNMYINKHSHLSNLFSFRTFPHYSRFVHYVTRQFSSLQWASLFKWKNTSKFPAVCSRISFSYLELNNLPLWRRLCNKKPLIFLLLFTITNHINTASNCKEEDKEKSLKGKSLAVICPVRKFPLGIAITLSMFACKCI